MDGLDSPLNHILFISSLLFAIGMLGLMIRRNIIFILMSLAVSYTHLRAHETR